MKQISNVPFQLFVFKYSKILVVRDLSKFIRKSIYFNRDCEKIGQQLHYSNSDTHTIG